MKKILFPIFFIWSFDLHACLCDDFSDLKIFDQNEETLIHYDQPINIPSYSQKQLENLIHNYINEGDSFTLDSLLSKTDIELKKKVLSKQFSVPGKNGSFITNFVNLAVCYNNCELLKILIKHGADLNSSCSDGYNALTIATYRGATNIIKTLVTAGVNIDKCDANENTALIIAIRNSSTTLISLLVNLGANINLKTKEGVTPLTIAGDLKDNPMIEELVKNGADLELAGDDGFSPLTRAVDKNSPQVIELLVKLGANINKPDKNGNVAIKIAASKSHIKLITLLINLGADINLISKGATPLTIAVDHDDNLMIKELVKNGSNLELAGVDGFSPLTRAVYKNSSKTIKLLIKLGANINKPDQNGNTALTIAIRESHINIAKQLIQLGADINTGNQKGSYPLIDALVKNNQQLAEILLSKNVNLNARDSNGNTALHLAIENSYDKLIPLLINKGADPEAQNEFYINPILLAASYGKKDIAKKLLKKQSPNIEDLKEAIYLNDEEAFRNLLELCKINPFTDNEKNFQLLYAALNLCNMEVIKLCYENETDILNLQINERTPLHFAVMRGHYKLVKHFVEQCNINVNILDYYGSTPLHYAAMYGNYEIADYLITKKCDPNIQIKEDFDFFSKGATPLDLAIQYAHTDIINLLVAHNAKTKITQKPNSNSKQVSHLAIFIDHNVELIQPSKKLISVNKACAEEIYNLIKQKTCPILIFGQHLLNNALSLSCSLKDWLILEIKYDIVEGYVLVPQWLILSSSNSKETIKSALQNLGFQISTLQHNYVTEESVINKKTNYQTVDEKIFDNSIPTIIDELLTSRERIIYWAGHGCCNKKNPMIGGISKIDAEKLFDIFANKKTKFIYITSCFLGGINLDAIKNFKDMAIVTSATTEIETRKRCDSNTQNWRGFFDIISAYKDFSHDGSYNDYCSFLANQAFPLIITQSPDISNFPHIKLPGDTKSTLLAINNEALLINKELISKNKMQDSTILVDNKRLVEVDLTKIENPIEIKKTIPLLISNYYKNIFEKISIENVEKNFVDILKALTQVRLFKNSTLENIFLIKELTFSGEYLLDINNMKTKLPMTLYNFLIQRGPSNECSVYFNTDKNTNQQNSVAIVYDNATNTWEAFATLSAEEFDLYQQLLINTNN